MRSDQSTRRRFLKCVSTTGAIVGVAGCNERESSIASPTTTTKTDTRTHTDSPAPTETPVESQVEPLTHDKLVGAFYYPWYQGEDGVPGFTSKGWSDITPGEPVLGEYESADLEVINQHIKWAVEYGINGFLVGGMFQEENFRFLDSPLADYLWYAVLEGIPERDTRVWDNYTANPGQWFADRFRYMADVHFPRESYLRMGETHRPVLYIYAAANRSQRLVDGILAAREAISEEVYLIADLDFWQAPSDPTDSNSCREIARAFDAVTMYLPYQPFVLQRHPELQRHQEFIKAVTRRYQHWAVAADEYELDLIPCPFPGFDKTFAGERAVDWPVMDRSPEFFGEQCDRLLDFVDPEQETIFVTSFNEWPEYTAIEPAISYGTTYLDIVASEIALQEPEYFDPSAYSRVALEFNKTVAPSEVNPDIEDDRQLAFALDSLEFRDANGGVQYSYDIGTWGQEPVILEGAWGRSELGETTVRWFGGEQERGVLAVDGDIENAATMRLTGIPQVSNEITAEIRIQGDHIETLKLGVRGSDPNQFEVELS